MKIPVATARPEQFEPFGYDTRIACGTRQEAVEQCGLHLYAYEQHLQPEIREANTELEDAKHKYVSLRSGLYGRPIAVSDANMLSQEQRITVAAIFAALAVLGCLGANIAIFALAGAGLMASLVALGFTIFPVLAGHLAFESVVSKSRRLVAAVALGIVILIGAGFVKVGLARRDLTDRALTTTAPTSYVEGENPTNDPSDQEPLPQPNSEAETKRALSDGALFFIIATELAAGLFIGQIVHWATDEDYVVWRRMKKLAELIAAFERRIADLISRSELAKKYCLAGILRAENTRPKPRPPYFRALALIIACILVLGFPSWAQTIDHYQGILIDASASISRGGKSNALFHEYLMATKNLLLREFPSSRVWVSTISTESFGNREILKGWTPESHGVFTDDLNRARRQLASAFETKSSTMSPVSSGTDIFGALWHFKALVESQAGSASAPSKEVWIFSDMMNETKEFPMPELVGFGPQQMLERAKSEGLLVQMKGYEVHVCGASMAGMSAKEWTVVKEFWANYFSEARAELTSYSADVDCGMLVVT